jgi:hypothetical protein
MARLTSDAIDHSSSTKPNKRNKKRSRMQATDSQLSELPSTKEPKTVDRNVQEITFGVPR